MDAVEPSPTSQFDQKTIRKGTKEKKISHQKNQPNGIRSAAPTKILSSETAFSPIAVADPATKQLERRLPIEI